MNSKLITYLFIAILVLGGGLYLSVGEAGVSETDKAVSARVGTVVLHKSPSCQCCDVYGRYLGSAGYDIEVNEVNNVQDLSDIKRKLGVPQSLDSCHTMEVGEYVVEGHVPKAAVAKLLETNPDIAGIGMAGMPAGSPGMPGSKQQDFAIYEIKHDGARGGVFMRM